MLKVLRNIIMLAMGLLLFEACGKDDIADTTAPEAFITSPVEGAKYRTGETLMFTAEFADDTELDQCTVSLEMEKSSMGWDSPWTPAHHVFKLSGKKDAIRNQYLFEAFIPHDIMAGDYVIKVVTSDKSLNYDVTLIPITIAY